MKILNGAEQMLFDRPPQLSSAERRRVFRTGLSLFGQRPMTSNPRSGKIAF